MKTYTLAWGLFRDGYRHKDEVSRIEAGDRIISPADHMLPVQAGGKAIASTPVDIEAIHQAVPVIVQPEATRKPTIEATLKVKG